MMTTTRGALLSAGALAVAISISACGSAVTAGTQTDTARPWEVSFELSGGIAGMTKQMTISHDGRLVAENLKRRTRAEKRISPDQLQDLDRMVGQYQPAPAAATGILSRRCADCIHYRLTVTGPGERPALSESGTIEQQQSRSPELVRFLTAILNETIQP